MNNTIVFMFSGQGSQYFKMGGELYQKHPRFRAWMDYCDDLVRPHLNDSLTRIIYDTESKNVPFDQIEHSNPAILSIEFSLARMLMESGIQPDCLLGYSLGELGAAAISGAIEIGDALKLSIDFANILNRESPAAGMLAIMGELQLMEAHPDWFESCWISSINFTNNFVVGGLREDIAQLKYVLDRHGVVTHLLPVNFGFHTPLLEPLRPSFMKLAENLRFAPAKYPLISSLNGGLVKKFSSSHLWSVVRHPVIFDKTITKLQAERTSTFIDVGPSGTLATFGKYISNNKSASTFIDVINQFGRDIDSVEKVLGCSMKQQ